MEPGTISSGRVSPKTHIGSLSARNRQKTRSFDMLFMLQHVGTRKAFMLAHLPKHEQHTLMNSGWRATPALDIERLLSLYCIE